MKVAVVVFCLVVALLLPTENAACDHHSGQSIGDETEHRCDSGSRSTHHCEDGYAYDVALGICAPAATVNCGNQSDGFFASTCHGKPDGVYRDYTTQCHNYYWCESGEKTEFTCGEQLVFDVRTSTCTDPHSSPCNPPTCSSETSAGFHMVPDTGGRLFYHCSGEHSASSGKHPLVHVCPPGQTFDSSVSACRSLPIVPPTLPDCSGKSDGYFPDVSNNCQSYYYCSNQRLASVLSCPHGHLFDISIGQCRDDVLVHCAVTYNPGESLVGCDGRANGYYPDYLTKCQNFYYCYNEKRTLNMSCPERQLFNNVLEKCDVAHNVVCLPTTMRQFESYCLNKVDGFYPNFVTGCKSYVYCQGGTVTSEVTCPKGALYDISKKRCMGEEFTSCLPSPGQTCIGRIDGYYADVASGCRKYFYCVHGAKLTEKSCPYRKQFDVEKQLCIEEDPKTCVASGRSIECIDKSDGYYPNLRSGCRKFFYCRTERKINELSCPPQQMFDQDRQACSDKHGTTCGIDGASESCNVGGHQGDVNTGCRTYFACVRGLRVETSQCPPGHIFDSQYGVCILESHATCQSEQREENNCFDKTDGFYPISAMPGSLFYQCQDGHAVALLECPPGSQFNSYSARCEMQFGNNLSCATSGICCAGLPSAYYVHSSTKSVYFCSSNFIRNITCPGNLQFNETSASCENRQISNATASSTRYYSGTDGMHADHSTSCHNFHVVVNGQVQATGVCPWNKAFDQFRGVCVPQDQVTCPMPNATIANYNCTRKPSGRYADVGSGCSVYYVCVGGEVSDVVTCADGKIFNEESGLCLNFQSSTCHTREISVIMSTSKSSDIPIASTAYTVDQTSETESTRASHNAHSSTLHAANTMASSNVFLLGDIACKDAPNGVYPDYESGCRQFYICFRQVKMGFSCSNAQLFNIKTNTCDEPENVVCNPEPPSLDRHPNISAEDTNDVQSGERSAGSDILHRPFHDSIGDFTCFPFETGFFPDFRSGCRDFYICFRGTRKQYSCPADLLFDPKTKNCDAPENVDCSHTLQPKTQSQLTRKPDDHIKTETSKQQSPEIPLTNCPANSQTITPDYETGCRKYIVCSKGEKHVMACPLGTLYNAKLQRCDLESNVDCESKMTTDSGTLVTNPGSLYVTTTSTTTHHPSTRPASLRSSKLQEVPPVAVSTVAPPFDCTAMADGFYPDYSRHCHVFYRCLRGRKLSYYCKLGQLFNPILQVCDFEQNVSCRNATSP